MKILALEFSSPVRGVAVTGGPKPGYSEESGGRQTRPFALIDTALREAELTRDEVECIAVGLGPGSNAGVRTAIAIAQGWQLARGIKLLGISSADAVAAHGGQLGKGNPLFVGLAARDGELWMARYEVAVFEHPRLVEPFRAMSVSAAELKPFSVFRMDGHGTQFADGSCPMFPKAGFLGILAAQRTNFVRGETLEPVSLHPVQFVKAPIPGFATD